MVHSRWQIAIVSFACGIFAGLFLSYSLSGGVRKEPVWTNGLKTPLPLVRELVVEEPKSKPKPKPKPKPKTTPAAPAALPKLASFADRLAGASYTKVEDQYYGRLSGVQVSCATVPHIGRKGDGGWEVCMAPAFKPRKPCLVYSFGVNNIWEFDEAMARDYGCTVRAFDPSMSLSDHVHQPGPVNFYKIGLGGSERTLSSGWKLFTFHSLLTRFGEADRTLDLVKIDIEYSEWESFESMLATGVLQRTKQLLFETHTNDLNNVITSKTDYLRYHKILDAIEALGFRRFFRHDNQFGIGPVTGARGRASDQIYRKSADLRRTCCHELYYVNMRFAKDMTGLTFV